MIKRVLLAKTGAQPGNKSELASEKPLELEYYLIVNIPDCYLAKEETEVYGMLVAKKLDEGTTEEEFIRSYSSDRDDTVKVVGKLAANKVTPLELPYIIDDLLGA